jgi:multiple sugar transport system permease protein
MRLPWPAQRKLWAYAFISLPFLYFLVVNFAAMLAAFSFSFQEYNTLSTVRSFNGIDNYRQIFGDPEFWQSLRNTLVVALVRVPLLTVLGLGVALLLHSVVRGRAFFRLLFFLPFVTSGVAIAWVFKFMYLPNFGLFTAVFDFFNVPRVNFLGDPRTALMSIVAVTIWSSIGFYALLFLAGLEDIPADFYEAAEVDGANGWQRFRFITIPLLNRTFVLTTVLCLISSLQTFTPVRMMSAEGFGGPLGSTRTLPLLIYMEAFSSMSMGRASAISVVFFVIILVASLLQQKALTREVEY